MDAEAELRAHAIRGHLEALILAALEDGPRHGYGIGETLSTASGALLQVPTGSLYPALHRLEREGLVDSEWSTGSGRRRREYRLTVAGRRALHRERSSWSRLRTVIDTVLGT